MKVYNFNYASSLHAALLNIKNNDKLFPRIFNYTQNQLKDLQLGDNFNFLGKNHSRITLNKLYSEEKPAVIQLGFIYHFF